MKIGLISALYPPNTIGGAEVMSEQLVEGLRSHNIDVSVLALQSPNQFIEDAEHVNRIKLRNIYWPYERSQKTKSNFQRLIWHTLDTSNFWMTHLVTKWAKKQKLDLINTNNLQGFSTGIWPALKKLEIPIVHVLHDFSLLCPRTVLYKNNRVCGIKNQRCIECRLLTAPRAEHTTSIDAVVGVSDFVLKLHRENGLFKQTKSEIIYNALQPDKLNKEYSFRNNRQNLKLGFLGRLDKPKGIHVLLEAAELLRIKGLHIEWIIAGKGEKKDIENWIISYPKLNIEWRGHIDPDTLWPDIDALVFPSNSYEALGNVIIEAAAAGRPTIASRHGGATELIDEGVSGVFFHPGNPEDLARVIYELDQQPEKWKKMGEQAYKKAATFTLERRIQEFKKLFEKVIHENRK